MSQPWIAARFSVRTGLGRVKNFKGRKCVGVTVTAPYKYVTCHHVRAVEIRKLKGKWCVGGCPSEVIIPMSFINVGHFVPESI
jgi:hypothetical protein